jgi:hypothetical protein
LEEARPSFAAPRLASRGRRRTAVSRIPVQSSNLASVEYYRETMTLEIEFKNGAIYQYFDVPEAIYEGLMTAGSKGQFLNRHIKGLYRYAKL